MVCSHRSRQAELPRWRLLIGRKRRVLPIRSSLLAICPLDSSLVLFNRRAVSFVRKH